MFIRKATLALVAALVAALTSSAFAYPWHRSNRYNPHRVFNSISDRDVARYNDRNVYKNNRSSYSRYPTRNSYRSYPVYNDRYYAPSRNDRNAYYRDGYYDRGRYYNNGPSVQIGPVRIDL